MLQVLFSNDTNTYIVYGEELSIQNVENVSDEINTVEKFSDIEVFEETETYDEVNEKIDPSNETLEYQNTESKAELFPEYEPTPLAVDFSLTVTEDIPQVKAGQAVGYEIILENTGDVNLDNLEIRGFFDDGNINGEWLETEGLIIDHASDTAILSLLEAGMEKTIVLLVNIPEERQENLEAEFVAKVQNPQEAEIISRSASLLTEIIPLKIDFVVKKWADRTTAVPGDTIMYQICIRNTGERSLHSVLTTEKFREAGLKAQFQEQEGVILNGAKTEALIAEIKPGEAYGLYAAVTLPEDFTGGDILNEVTVVTRETGETEFFAQAAVNIEEPVPTEIPYQQIENITSVNSTNFDIRKEIPQTEDLSETELWAGAFGLSCLVVIGIYWFRKAKRKH